MTAKSYYGIEVGDSADSSAATTAEILDVFEFLKPKATKTPLIRIGGDIDGAYLVPDDLDGIAACFSPGVNKIKYFEDFLADHSGIQSHMCDFSSDVEQLTTPLKPGMQAFLKKWLDVSGGEDSISLEDWIQDRAPQGDSTLVEVAGGRPYQLSSAYGKSSRTGVVQPRGNYFFHTEFGKDQSIRVDLGSRHCVRRIEVTNRQDRFQERAKHIFAVLSNDAPDDGARRVFPMYAKGPLPDGAWQECAIDVPDVSARYVMITSPMNTALHFSDLKIYAADEGRATRPAARWTARRVLRGVRNRVRRLRPSRVRPKV